ncbi:MAG: serine/threonine-protein kinase [Gemmataceae bacterium]
MDPTTDGPELPPPPGLPPDGVQALSRLLAPGDPSPAGYEVVRRLGRGAMGDVYLARQLSLKRQVALKLIRADRLARTPAVRDRFRAEAETVARLSHPHIVQIFEVGEDAGRPFLALEYLGGGSLDARLSKAPLAPDAAAKLVADVAAGVQHAHDRGIVHRDLKPGNVLLAADGTPKVGDFGLARVVGDLAGDPAAGDSGPGLTQVGSVLGTPSYMAPEQAAGDTHRIGPRTDVYALGGLLFECLTGRPPFKAPTPAETLELVLQLDPPSPRQFQPTVPRDLETVCLKCLRKDPDRRYQSARELADDLGRFLRREPVTARPFGRPERLVKWARRRPGPAVLAGLLAVAAVGLVVGAVVYERQLRSARDAAQKESEEATRQKGRAEANARRAADAVHRFLTRVGDERLKQVPEMEGVRAELLRDALEFYQGLLADADAPDPAVRVEAARAFTRVGLIQQYLGRTDEAEAHFRQAAERFAQLAADDPGNRSHRTERAAALHSLANLKTVAAPGQAAEAIDAARREWQGLAADAPDDPWPVRQAAGCDHFDGQVLALLGQQGRSEQAHRRALAARQALADRFPADPSYRRDLAYTLHNLAAVCSRTGRAADAREHEAAAVRLFEEQHARDRADEEAMKQLSAGLYNLGVLLGPTDSTAALGHQRRALDLRLELARRHPRVPDYQGAVGESSLGLVTTLIQAGQPAEAVDPGRRGAEVMERLVRDHPTADARWTLATLLANLSHPMAAAGKPADAARDLDRAVELLGELVCEAPGGALYWESLAGTCLSAGNHAGGTARRRDALDWFARGIAAAEEALRLDPQLSQAKHFRLFCHGARAQTLGGLGDHPAAVRDWDRVVALAADAERRTYRFMRLEPLVRAGDLARFKTEADGLLPGAAKEPDELIHIAGCYAVASDKQADLAATAVDLIRRAVEAAPPTDRAKRMTEAHNNAQIRRLHGRPDYQQLRAKWPPPTK